MGFLDIFAEPLGKVLLYIYENFSLHNYGIALVIFTIIIRLVLAPLMIKQYSSTQKMQQLQPEIKEIQRKYKNDKAKLNEELMKLYQTKGFNPAGGCLPTLIQFPIFIALFAVISKPITYLANMPDKVEPLAKAFKMTLQTAYVEPKILHSITTEVAHKVLSNNVLVDKLIALKESMNFFGVNLTLIPSWHVSDLFGPNSGQYLILLLIPILSAITTYISAKMTTPQVGMEQNPMSKNMLYIFPIITLLVGFQFPAGMGLYWIVGALLQMLQQYLLNKYLERKDIKNEL